ncbi:MAG: o-succinylbenzoate synthase, partial [Microcystaceae cyanobacterium]
MKYRYFPYQRPFTIPFKTHHGVWSIRTGIIVILEDEKGRISKGEIAPLPDFGTESLSEAFAFCNQLPSTFSTEIINSISDSLPCCQFGFGSA